MRSRPLRLLLLLACLLASPARAAEPELTPLSISVRGQPCSALLLRPAAARALLVLAHGKLMDIHHPFMEGISAALARRGVATLRFNFPYAEAKREQVDPVPLLAESVRAATREAAGRRGSLPLLVGGKSVGALATAFAAQDGGLPEAQGVVILSYPLHAPGRPSGLNARALDGLTLPTLFVQGTRDALADLTLMTALVEQAGKSATLHLVQDGDHAFAPPEGSVRTQQAIYDEIAGAVASFAATLAPSQGG
jgi:predicted alpha/beta-hydrolase family hydrolase